MEYKLHTITTLDKLNQVYDYVLENISKVNYFVAYDTETTGACPISKEIIGYSISLFEDEGFYLPFLTMTDDRGLCTEAPAPIPKEGQNHTHEMHECVSPAFKVRALELLELLKNYKLLMHNAPFDVIVTRRNYGIDYIKSLYCDTLMLKHTLDCDKPHGLKDCGVKYFGEHAKDEQTELGGSVIRNGGKWTMKDKWVWHGDLYYVGKYASMDTCLTLRIFNYLDPQLDDLELRSFFYEDEVMPLLVYATIPMKDTGLKIDVGHYKRAKLKLQAEIDDLDRQIRHEIADVTGPIEQNILDAKYPQRPGGAFGERLISEAGLSLPVSPKTGRFSTAKSIREAWAKKVIKTATEDQIKVIWYVLGEADKVPQYLIHRVQRLLWEDKMDREIVNLGSPRQLEYIINTKWGIISPETTKSGDQSFNASVIEKITINRMMEINGLTEVEAEERFSEYMECESVPIEADWFIKFLRKRKLEKLVNAFIDGILDKAIEGRIHPDMLQFGTTSGRYSSKNPNCLSTDTEILTDKGWLTYERWEADAKVAAVKDGRVNWEFPSKIWISPEQEQTMVSLKNTHMDIRCTDNHRIDLKTGTNNIKTYTFSEVYDKVLDKNTLIHGAYLTGGGIPLTDGEIRFIVAFQADGSIYNGDKSIRFTFSKERKNQRLIDLLDELGIDYTHQKKPSNKYESGYRYEFYVHNMSRYISDLSKYIKDKVFNWGLLLMSESQRQLFLEELDHWDGLSTRPRTSYNSCIEQNVDVVQALCALNNERAHKREYDYNVRNGAGSLSYQLGMTQRNYSYMANIKKYKLQTIERVWCVEVPSDQFIARRGSDTFVIRNCQQLPAHSALGAVIKKGFVA